MVKTWSVFHWKIDFVKLSLKSALLAFLYYSSRSVDVNIKI